MSVLLQKGLGWTDGLISAEKEGRRVRGQERITVMSALRLC